MNPITPSSEGDELDQIFSDDTWFLTDYPFYRDALLKWRDSHKKINGVDKNKKATNSNPDPEIRIEPEYKTWHRCDCSIELEIPKRHPWMPGRSKVKRIPLVAYEASSPNNKPSTTPLG